MNRRRKGTRSETGAPNVKTFMVMVMMGLGSLAIASSADAFQGEPAAVPAAEESSTTEAALLTTVLHTLSSGGVAEAEWGDELSRRALAVVSQTTDKNSGALVTYHSIVFDPASQVCADDPVLGTFCRYTRSTSEILDAFISPDDFTITANTARLGTDVMLASFLFFNHCVGDDITGTADCTDVLPTGLINLEWRRTGASSERAFGITESKWGQEIFRVSGARDSFSAYMTGSVLGIAVQNVLGDIGTNRSVSIDILRAQQ